MTEGQQNKMNLHQGNMRAPRHQCREEEPVSGKVVSESQII